MTLRSRNIVENLEKLVPGLAQYFLDHGVKLNHHDEQNEWSEFNIDQPEGAENAIVQNLFGPLP